MNNILWGIIKWWKGNECKKMWEEREMKFQAERENTENERERDGLYGI